MSEKVVLPRFDLPRDTTRIAIRAAWAAGALMVVATLVLGMALWHRRSAQLAAAEQVAAKAEAARRAAMAPPPAPKAVAAAPGAPTLGKKGETKTDTTLAAVVPAAAGAEPGSGPRHASARGHHAGKVGHGRAIARGGADAKGSAAGSARTGRPAGKTKVDDDFIDKLLSK